MDFPGVGWVYWPMCKTPGCGNRMNRAAGNGYCWPCQPSGKTYEELIQDMSRATEELEEIKQSRIQ